VLLIGESVTKWRSGVEFGPKVNYELHAIRMDGLSLVEESAEFGKLPSEGPAGSRQAVGRGDQAHKTHSRRPLLNQPKAGQEPVAN